MTPKSSRIALFITLVYLLGSTACSEGGNDMSTDDSVNLPLIDNLPELQEKLAELNHQTSLVKDSNDIKRLQRAYGYYVDKADWDNVVDLLTEDATAEYGLAGVYAGKEKIKALLYAFSSGESGLREGQLSEHMQLQPVITVAADGMTARGRWRNFGMIGQFGESAMWEEGPYENEYRKEDGVWRFCKTGYRRIINQILNRKDMPYKMQAPVWAVSNE